MSERSPHRRPQTFKLDDPGVVVMDADESGRQARGAIRVMPEGDPASLPVPIDAPLLPVRRDFRWGTVFWTALGELDHVGAVNDVVGVVLQRGAGTGQLRILVCDAK